MRLFRISNLLSLLLATFFGVLLFWTSQSVQMKEDELAKVKKNLAHEQETMRVLSVEWDYLNRPQRLEKLAIEQLGMEPAGGTEMVKTVSDIPEPVVDPSMDEGYTQPVSFDPAPVTNAVPKPVASPAPVKETVSPAKAEKQSFDRLIQSLDAENTEGQ